MVKLLTYKDINTESWRELLHNSENASYFQSPDCYQFYNSLPFLKPFAFGIENQGILKAVVCGYLIADGGHIKRIMTKRAIVPGGILTGIEVENNLVSMLLDEIKKFLTRQNAIYIEFRNYSDYSGLKPAFEKSGFKYNPHLNFHLEIKDVETSLMNLNTTKRRDIRTSQKNGASWELSESEADMKAYYSILNHLYQTRIKTPLFPEDFFQKLIKTSNGRFLAVKLNGEVIGGSVCVELPGRYLYEWFVCGLDGQFKNVFPSTVATWAAIEYAAKNGLSRFDMMGAGKPEEGYGVREFKSKFGGTLVEHGRFLAVLNPLLYAIGKKAVQILKKSKK